MGPGQVPRRVRLLLDAVVRWFRITLGRRRRFRRRAIRATGWRWLSRYGASAFRPGVRRRRLRLIRVADVGNTRRFN